MRANEPIRFCEDVIPMINKNGTADYINQLRYERLMAKAREFRNEALYNDAITDKRYNQCLRIAEALEARAKNIKEGM